MDSANPLQHQARVAETVIATMDNAQSESPTTTSGPHLLQKHWTTLRVGLVAGELSQWGGGRDLLRLFAIGLHEAGAELALLVPSQSFRHRAWQVKRILRWGMFRLAGSRNAGIFPRADRDQLLVAREMRELIELLRIVHCGSTTRAVVSAAKENQLELILPYGPLNPAAGIPSVGYIPDLQHTHLPHLFTSRERLKRDRLFSNILEHSRTVVVNSKDTKHNLEQFYPHGSCQIVALPFSPILEDGWLDTNTDMARAKYGLGEKYVMVSNQLWVHKDHGTVLKAFARFPDKDFQLVCTGSLWDHRAPSHFESLQTMTRELQIAGRVKFLGLIPKLDQIAIMRGAAALVQPTLYEGGPGGGSVYNAIALGVPCVISNIAVNQEIQEDGATFFCAGNDYDLAQKMEEVVKHDNEKVGRDVLVSRSNLRRHHLGLAFEELIKIATRR